MLTIPRGQGNPAARIVILKDMPSFDECRQQEYLADSPGREFRKMLGEAGIMIDEIFTTSLSRSYIPGDDGERFSSEAKKRVGKEYFKDKMYVKKSILDDMEIALKEIAAVRPNIVVPIGALSLFLAIGETSLNTWRGSVNMSEQFQTKIIPTLDPSLILKVWNWRYMSVRDLQRVRAESEFPEMRTPEYSFQISPSYMQVMVQLQKLINAADKLSGGPNHGEL